MNNARTRPVHVLLVEDNPGDIRLTQEAFREGNIEVDLSVVTDGEAAIDYLRSAYDNAPDLVLLDLNLPKRNGRQVLEAIRTDPHLRKMPVLMLSTSDAQQDIVHSYNLNANCYIKKPFDFDEFSNIIKQIEEFWLKTVLLPSSSC